MIKKILSILLLNQIVVGNFPDNLDSFLGLLFDTEACENFVANADFLGVATSKCDPYTCDFPHEMCMRPSALYKEPKANQCRSIPQNCLIAANNGMPLPPRKLGNTSPPNPEITPIPQSTTPPIRIIPPKSKTVVSKGKINVCRLEIAQGRFCGFKQMWFWNKEHKLCEQFWFPGCTTKDSNGNLFENQDKCIEATKHCIEELAGKFVTPAPIKNTKKTTRKIKIINKVVEMTTSMPVDPREYGGNALVGGKAVKQNNLLGMISSVMKPRPGGNKKRGGKGKGNNMNGGLGGLGSLAQLGNSGSGGNALIQGLMGSMAGMVGNGNSGGGSGEDEDFDYPDLTPDLYTSTCLLPRSLGDRSCSSNSLTKRFYYHSLSSTCKSFWYFGCNGNKNNFKTIKGCQKICGKGE
uniref:BPTI/Kunitz inhibitor domain-containing protein n=1 Tax=Parastrongyloides trichosuri TaxID=131310 RepID=A0A0N4ZT83_PARTI